MLAVISDVHGNLSALEAVLRDVEAAGVDALVCLGDVASFGPQPREALRCVQALGCPVVMGNTDNGLLQSHTLGLKSTKLQGIFAGIEHWCAEQLTEGDRAFIRTFQPTVSLKLDSLRLLCFHGSPGSYNDVIVATTPDERLEELLAGWDAAVMLGGHSHVQLLRRFQNITFVNPGSVGSLYELLPNGEARSPAWAEYALVEVVRGQPSITFRRVPYDVRPLLETTEKSGMPHAAWWSADWLR